METRKIEKLNIRTSLLGFGCMRFPMKDGQIDKGLTEAMIDKAYASGVRYYDTAYPYHDGKSEGVLGAIIKKYPRHDFFVADKMPVWILKEAGDPEKIFAQQLERLGMEYIDFYLLHGLNKSRIETIRKYDLLGFLRGKKAEGKIRFMGFSFHDTPEVLREILDLAQWDFVQIQLNYVDWEQQRAKELYQILEQRNIPCIVMEPVKGGDLASPIEPVRRIFESVRPGASPASWALRFAASLPQVKVVLSGMSDSRQVEDNLQTFSSFEPLSSQEQGAIERAVKAIDSMPHIGCTGCRYCMPCPAGVNIPDNFRVYNDYHKFGVPERLKQRLQALEKGSATKCVQCRACVAKCPQHLDIPQELKKVRAVLEKIK